jgi:putative membrane protein
VRRLLIRLLINVVGLYVAVQLVPGVQSAGSWTTLLGVAVILGLVNVVVRPVLTILTGPLILLTLGLFLLVVNALTLWLAGLIASGLGLGFQVDGFIAAFWGALVLTVVNWALTILFGEHRRRRRI